MSTQPQASAAAESVDESKGVEVPTVALRDNAGKANLAQLLLFLPALQELAAHCDAGRAKYPDTDGRPNWLAGGKPDEEYLNAALRHLGCIINGEEYDAELGTTHAAAVLWNLCAYVTCNKAGRAPTRDEQTRRTVQAMSAHQIIEDAQPEAFGD